MWQKQIPPSEIDRMDYWEFEEMVKMFNIRIEEENDKSKKQQQEQEEQQNRYKPQMPNFSNFSPSNFSPRI